MKGFCASIFGFVTAYRLLIQIQLTIRHRGNTTACGLNGAGTCFFFANEFSCFFGLSFICLFFVGLVPVFFVGLDFSKV